MPNPASRASSRSLAPDFSRLEIDILGGIDDVAFCTLTSADVVRHRLVGEIVEAYGRYDATVGLRPAAPHRGPRRA